MRLRNCDVDSTVVGIDDLRKIPSQDAVV